MVLSDIVDKKYYLIQKSLNNSIKLFLALNQTDSVAAIGKGITKLMDIQHLGTIFTKKLFYSGIFDTINFY